MSRPRACAECDYGSGRRVRCPRCREEIFLGEQTVRSAQCPLCLASGRRGKEMALGGVTP